MATKQDEREERIRKSIHERHASLASEPMPEHEFATLTFDGFKKMSDTQKEATIRRMDGEQFNRWLDRCVPPKNAESLDSFTASLFRRRKAGLIGEAR